MTELTYEVPVVGEKHRASDPRVTTALTEIRTVLNGRLTAGNFASETLTPKKFPKTKWAAQEAFGPLATGESIEKTVSANTAVLLMLGKTAGKALLAEIQVGGAPIARVGAGTLTQALQWPVGPFRVPAGETWAVFVRAGTLSSGTFSYQANVG